MAWRDWNRLVAVLMLPAMIYLLAGHAILPDSSSLRRGLQSDTQSTTQQGQLKYHNAIGEAQQTLSLIYRRYELDKRQGSNLFRSSNNIDEKTWDMIKYNLAHKLLVPNSTFLMVFGGSSVTAGHDNFYNQSYPFVFQRRMERIFKAMGIELIVRNIAMGANNCVPYIFCYESMGGADPDFLGWEQSYNCGRDNGVFEYMARQASWSANPCTVYFSASGAWAPTSCPKSEDPVPFCFEEWTPEMANLTAWVPQLNEVESEKDALIRFNAKTPSSTRFASSYRNEYPSVGVHGFNVWEKNADCIAQKDGKNITCNGIDAAEGCAMKFMSFEASVYGQPSGKGANWHPPRGFHLLRGEALAWVYSLIAVEAVFMAEQDLIKGDLATVREGYRQKLLEMRSAPMPSPKHCQAYHCEEKSVCFADYKPHFFTAKEARAKLEGAGDNSTAFHQATYDMTLSELVVGNFSGWRYDAAEYSAWSTQFGYLDTKPVYIIANKDQGELRVKIDLRGAGPQPLVWLCGVHKDDKMGLLVDLHVSAANLSAYVPPVEVAQAPFDASFGVLDQCEDKPCRFHWDAAQVKRIPGTDCDEISGLPSNQIHVVGIQPAEDNKHPMYLTHVILFPHHRMHL